jgi:glutamine amidotransferase PdxT
MTDLQAGRGDDAVAYAEKHLAGETASSFQLQMLSAVYDKAGRKQQSLDTLDMAISRETNAQQRVSMQFQEVDMLVLDKNYAAAETLLRSLHNANQDDKQTLARVNSELVRIYQMQGRIAELNL